jgi:hypothetical protein
MGQQLTYSAHLKKHPARPHLVSRLQRCLARVPFFASVSGGGSRRSDPSSTDSSEHGARAVATAAALTGGLGGDLPRGLGIKTSTRPPLDLSSRGNRWPPRTERELSAVCAAVRGFRPTGDLVLRLGPGWLRDVVGQPDEASADAEGLLGGGNRSPSPGNRRGPRDRLVSTATVPNQGIKSTLQFVFPVSTCSSVQFIFSARERPIANLVGVLRRACGAAPPRAWPGVRWVGTVGFGPDGRD